MKGAQKQQQKQQQNKTKKETEENKETVFQKLSKRVASAIYHRNMG